MELMPEAAQIYLSRQAKEAVRVMGPPRSTSSTVRGRAASANAAPASASAIAAPENGMVLEEVEFCPPELPEVAAAENKDTVGGEKEDNSTSNLKKGGGPMAWDRVRLAEHLESNIFRAEALP